MTAIKNNSKLTKLLCLAGALAITGCATQRPVPVKSEIISTNAFVNTAEWAGFKEPVENMVRAAYANDCDVRIILTKVDRNRAEVRQIEIHPARNTQ